MFAPQSDRRFVPKTWLFGRDKRLQCRSIVHLENRSYVEISSSSEKSVSGPFIESALLRIC